MPLPSEIDVYYDDSKPPIRCVSLADVDAALDKLEREAAAAQCPRAVAIKLLGHEIDMGVGADPTFLCLQIAPCDGEYYVAVGKQRVGEPKMFYGAGQDSYWEPKNLIPTDAARSAVRYFIDHQKRSPLLRWQDWNGRDA